jgi:type IX secretion system PorP/SprF family membrane protein
MKRIIYILIIFSAIKLSAQQDPQISHYFFLKGFYNPAYTGLTNDINIHLLSHQQWRKFENAPLTNIFSIDAPLNLFNGSEGIGINIVDDRYGFVRDFRANLNLAYNFDVGIGVMSVGVSPGIFSKKFEPQWKFPDQTEQILSSDQSATIFDLGAGVYYTINNVFLGLSSFHLLRPSFYFTATDNSTSSSIFLTNHFYFNGGYSFKTANQSIELTPSFLLKTDMVKLQYDINLMALYNKKVWAGVTYRNKDAVAFFIGTSYFFDLKLGFSYDLILSNINRVATNTMEAYIGYSFSFFKASNAQKYRNVKTL